ncbi:MAG: aldehyde ferredoxin oxidoreductase family protein, partial [Candidatus Hydrothermarchaeota archaeon]|nr:aldehyde ferredoxin oxidoreductase family protein [Candidatus Hydrothermarchaeota archaeon]
MGYLNRILDVDLSTGKISQSGLDDELKKKFLGGKGIAAKLLYDRLTPHIDALSEKNMLIFMTGPLTGTMAPSSGRFCCVSKSPLTGTIFDSHCGGHFGHELKRAGFDGIVVKGKSKSKVFLSIDNGEAELLDAQIWGKDTRETEAWVNKKLDKKCRILSIGKAGENLVRFASIIHEGHRALGRGGLGAVMGSKNLKAIAVRGDKKIPIYDAQKFKEAARKCYELLAKHPSTGKKLKEYGTPNIVSTVNSAGLLPTRNFQTGFFEDAEKISGEEMRKFVTGNYSCFSCSIKCGKKVDINGVKTESLEYETIYSFGSNCGNSSLSSIAKANELCNKLGLDTISTGATIAFFIELVEKGFVSYDIKWGQSEKILELIEKIALREGVGNALAEGVKRLSEKYDCEFAMQVKGLELPGYDSRGAVGQSLAYATNNEGGSHMRAPVYIDEILTQRIDRFEKEGKARLVKDTQDFHASLDSLILCKFTSRALREEHYSQLLDHATGINFELRRIGERIFNLERLFNLREGFTRHDDALPARFLKERIPAGNSKGSIADLELDEYYMLRGWDSEGKPKPQRLKTL